tara:strand:- start:276 stop:623 length:348 start_codon:yes stop_codon:yes gene_type:complete
MERKHLYFVVESASSNDLKKAEKNENFDPWYPHIYYPSVIINQFNDTLLNEETEFDLGFIRANSDVYQLAKKCKGVIHYRVKKHWRPSTGFKHGESITYCGHYEKSKSQDEWASN